MVQEHDEANEHPRNTVTILAVQISLAVET